MPLGSSGPYTEQNIINEVFSSGSAALRVILGAGGTGSIVTGTGGDDVLSQTATGQVSQSVQYLFNASGTVWERQRGNYYEAALTSSLRAGTTTSTVLTNYNSKGAFFLVDITVGTTTGTIATLNIQGSLGTGFYNVGTFLPALLTGSGAFLLYPGVTGTHLGTVVNAPLPRNYRVQVVPVTPTASVTYSVTVCYIL